MGAKAAVGGEGQLGQTGWARGGAGARPEERPGGSWTVAGAEAKTWRAVAGVTVAGSRKTGSGAAVVDRPQSA